MKLSYINYRDEFPNISQAAFNRMFYINMYWDGKIIIIGVYHYAISLDLRKDWVADMMGEKYGEAYDE